MRDRDYLWCALNLALDREEELERFCPQCRQRVEESCPACGEPKDSWGVNDGFDWARFEQMKRGMGCDRLAGGAAVDDSGGTCR